jgi:drug/metabolite transporter (DMT)-like permease
MFGIFLTAIGTFFEEISSSFGKWEILHKEENIYTFGFINYFWVLIIFIIFAVVKNNFIFNPASIPILGVSLILEMAQTYSTLHAIKEADRSTLGFLMIGTIPLLLVVDIILGYKVNLLNIFGISAIILGLIILLVNHGINKKGIGYVIFSTINAAATISIYKYCITHFNSVEAQQIITFSFLLIFLFIMSIWKFKENPFYYIFKKKFLFQSISNGVGGVIVSFAYVFAPASVITSGKRASSVLWAIISGNKYFHERHILIKIISFVFIVIGLVFLIM